MAHLQMGSTEQFTALREHFQRSGFTDVAIRQRLKFPPELELALPAVTSLPLTKPKIEDCLDVLIHLFLVGDSLPAAEVAPYLPAAVWEAMRQTRLVQPEPDHVERLLASVALYPIRDLYIASDRWTNPDHTPRQTFPDIVYPALTRSARQFIDYTSYEPCEDFLELCAGTAPAALLAAGAAKHVWVTDIAERSIEFAKFNAALNGIHNVNFAQGDLYQPVAGRTFDRIAAHPPYVPVLQPAEIFYGGGDVGEEITQRVIAELPARLKPGGRLYCRTLGTEGPGHSFEQRIRRWLGESHLEFDVGVFALQTLDPRRFALSETLNRNGGREQFAEWERLFSQKDIQAFVLGMVIIQRVSGHRPVFTIRRTIHNGTPASAIEWAMRWETAMQLPDAMEKRLQAKLLANPSIEVIVRHVLRDGEISPENFTLGIETPFATDCKVQPWIAFLLPRCDGKTTVADLFETAKQNGWIAPEAPMEEFGRLLATLISGGFLQTEEFRLPVAAG